MCSHPQILCYWVLDLGNDVYIKNTVLHETWPSNVESRPRQTRRTLSCTHTLYCLFYLIMSMQASDGRKDLAEAFVAGPRIEVCPIFGISDPHRLALMLPHADHYFNGCA